MMLDDEDDEEDDDDEEGDGGTGATGSSELAGSDLFVGFEVST